MRVLALVEGEDHVCFRYRFAAMRSHFAARGCELESLVLAGGVLAFYRQLAAIARADVVVLQRRLLAWWKLKLLRSAAPRLVFDVDDAVFLRDSNSIRSPHCPRRWRRFRATVRAADLVTAGNDFLASRARACLADADHNRVVRVPTVVDPTRYPLAQHTTRGASAMLVWIGSRSTMSSLADAQPALAAASQFGSTNLKVICDDSPRIAGVNVIACRWSEATEAQEIATSDIGVSWLPDHPWSEGKCGLKVLQYMAAGLPVVANPVAMHNKLVIDGVTGYLASTPAQWGAAIARLTHTPDLRQKLGRAARAFVQRHYSTGVWGLQLAEKIATLSVQRTRAAA